MSDDIDKNGGPSGVVPSRGADASARIEPSIEERAQEMVPLMERALLLSGQQDPTALSAALRPVVSRVVRGSPKALFRAVVVSVNRFLLNNFSFEGLRWRFEAARTGVTFKDVVHKHSRVCPVSQVFLIHRASGLLLRQEKSERSSSRDGDMVSSMLAAIDDFVHDSFNVDDGYGLQTVRVGEMTLLIEHGPLAILAGVVQGTAPEALRIKFQQALKGIHDEMGKRLRYFEGDTSVFSDSEPHLRACLNVEYLKGEDKVSPFTAVVLLVPLVALGSLCYFMVRQHIQWHRYLDALAEKPGITVVDHGVRSWKRFVHGFRDPMAEDPEVLLLQAGFSPSRVASRWEPYRSLDSQMSQAWAVKVLAPPASVFLRVDQGVLSASGIATSDWIEMASVTAMSIPGVESFVADRLIREDHDIVSRWKDYISELSGEPGILIVEKGMRDGVCFIVGFRDPTAKDPDLLLAKVGLSTDRVRSQWEFYESTVPELVLARAERLLEPPHSVDLSFEGGRLTLEGRASHMWIEHAVLLARGVAGIREMDVSGLVDSDAAAMQEVIQVIEGQVFYFLANKTDLWPGQDGRFRLLIANLRKLGRAASKAGKAFTIEIRGHTATTGDSEVDVSVSESVARRFLDHLRRKDLDGAIFTTKGMGATQPNGVTKGDRRREGAVSFSVQLQDL